MEWIPEDSSGGCRNIRYELSMRKYENDNITDFTGEGWRVMPELEVQGREGKRSIKENGRWHKAISRF